MHLNVREYVRDSAEEVERERGGKRGRGEGGGGEEREREGGERELWGLTRTDSRYLNSLLGKMESSSPT